jgi:radical SAM superfamily enzyme YgiQ (UPF0313 family)
LPAVYTDHPSFPEAILARTLLAGGFSVAIVQQPRWQGADAFAALPRPRLFFAIVPGPVDSVVLNYTSSRKRRREDLYQYDGKAYFDGLPESISSKIRPDRVITVFAARIRESFKDVPIIIGGLEGSLRRFTHWDFQQEKIRRSILLDTRADLLVTGMGEKQILAIAHALAAGQEARALVIPGTARVSASVPSDAVILPDAEDVLSDPALLLLQYQKEQEAIQQKRPAAQAYGAAGSKTKRFVVYEGPARYTVGEIDAVYTLPFTRTHDTSGCPAPDAIRAGSVAARYGRRGGKAFPPANSITPALRMNLFSVTTHRGCVGGCAFCSINAHEGHAVLSRSHESIVEEIRRMQAHPAWRGIIGDLGAASAEMYGADCACKYSGKCVRTSCLTPEPCGCYAKREGHAWLELLRRVRTLPGVRKVMVASGVRYETLLHNPSLLEELLTHHTGRFLRVAPEHTEDHVLALMRKSPHETFVRFAELFRKIAAQLSRPVELACYIVVGHPGETAEDVINMRKKLTALGLMENLDVQIFTPTPGSLSTAYYCAMEGSTPRSGREVKFGARGSAIMEGSAGVPQAAERDSKELIRRQRLLIPETSSGNRRR